MKKLNKLQIKNNHREQWEQQDQPKNSKDINCSQNKMNTENTRNKLITNIIDPISTPPFTPIIPLINRPCYMCHSDWFELSGRKMEPGLYRHDIQQKNGEAIDIDICICSPLSVEGITSSPNNDNFGRLLKFMDSNGTWHEWAMPMHLLKSNGDELRGELLNQGLTFNTKNKSDIVNYIMNEKPNRRIIAVDKIGWHNNDFVLPNQVIGNNEIVFQSEIYTENGFSCKGTLAEWQKEIGQLCIGNSSLIISVACALAGPILNRINRQQGGMIHWVGDSSSGKSTCAEIAASVWGPPEFVRSWSATANGMEGIAAIRNDTCLILDEIDEASPYEVGKIVYMLVNGQGKQRAGRKGNARNIQRWLTMTISTGERTLNSIMSDVGKQANSGQLVRLLSIPAAFEFGVFSNLHQFEDGRAFADHLKKLRLNYYGNLGPAFVRHLANDTQDLISLLDKIINKLSEYTTTSIEKRAASAFAVIALAGELAIEYKFLPWDKGSVLEAVAVSFQKWQEFQGTNNCEGKRILRNISNFITKHSDSRFSSRKDKVDPSTPVVRDRAGWYEDIDDIRTYMLTGEALEEAGGKYDKSRITRALQEASWIVDHDSRRHTKKVRTPQGLKNLYHICPKDESL